MMKDVSSDQKICIIIFLTVAGNKRNSGELNFLLIKRQCHKAYNVELEPYMMK
jgi:hypothetical protein